MKELHQHSLGQDNKSTGKTDSETGRAAQARTNAHFRAQRDIKGYNLIDLFGDSNSHRQVDETDDRIQFSFRMSLSIELLRDKVLDLGNKRGMVQILRQILRFVSHTKTGNKRVQRMWVKFEV